MFSTAFGSNDIGRKSTDRQVVSEETREKEADISCEVTEYACTHSCGGCGSRRVLTVCGKRSTVTHEPCNLQVCMQSSVVSNIIR